MPEPHRRVVCPTSALTHAGRKLRLLLSGERDLNEIVGGDQVVVTVVAAFHFQPPDGSEGDQGVVEDAPRVSPVRNRQDGGTLRPSSSCLTVFAN
jgi:hypothetical protein